MISKASVIKVEQQSGYRNIPLRRMFNEQQLRLNGGGKRKREEGISQEDYDWWDKQKQAQERYDDKYCKNRGEALCKIETFMKRHRYHDDDDSDTPAMRRLIKSLPIRNATYLIDDEFETLSLAISKNSNSIIKRMISMKTGDRYVADSGATVKRLTEDYPLEPWQKQALTKLRTIMDKHGVKDEFHVEAGSHSDTQSLINSLPIKNAMYVDYENQDTSSLMEMLRNGASYDTLQTLICMRVGYTWEYDDGAHAHGFVTRIS